MKILFLQLCYDLFGGIETVNDSLATKFSEDGYDVTVLCLWKIGKNEFIKEKNYKKIYIDIENKRPSYKKIIRDLLHFNFKNVFNAIKELIFSIKHTIKANKKFAKEIEKINPDYIIIGNYPLVKLVHKKYLKKSCIHMHSGFKYYLDNKKEKKFLLKYKNKIDKYIWLTPNFMDAGIKIGFNNSTYIYNPVRIRSKKENLLNQKNIAFIGRLSPEKRVDKLVRIFNNLNRKNWNLLIYGSGDTSNLEVKDNVHIMGPTSDVKEVLSSNSSIFALTSAYEGFPMVILEAYECGIPVIAYDFGLSTSEIIKDGETGYIIKQDNQEEYIKKMRYLCDNDEERRRMGKNAKQFVKQFYINEVVKSWYKLFKGEL